MKTTKHRLRRIIKEYYSLNFTPEEQAVIDALDELGSLIELMGQSNPDMTDYYINLLRALKKAGVDPVAIARMA